jgi:hypothetical protein
MSAMTPDLVTTFVTTTGIGFLMMVSGVQKHALEWKRRRRSCPSCGRPIYGRSCSGCVG